MANKHTSKINWHSAAYSALKIEFSQDAGILNFFQEKLLNTGPRRIDMIIIKKDSMASLQNPMGAIFRKYNLVEYKSPKQFLNINSYYKSLSYALSYKTLGYEGNPIFLDEITLTLISSHYPRKLIKELRKRNLAIEKVQNGVYYISKELIPVQLIVTRRLDERQHIWLKSLTDQFSDLNQARLLADAYKLHQNDPEYDNFMNILTNANLKMKKGGSTMCEAFYELFAPQLQQNWDDGVKYGRQKGEQTGLQKGLQQGLQKGQQQGQQQTLNLCDKLIKAGRLDDLSRACQEPDYLNLLLAEFGLVQNCIS